MPRKRMPPRLWFRKDQNVWIIRDSSVFLSTGTPDRDAADECLSRYLALKDRSNTPRKAEAGIEQALLRSWKAAIGRSRKRGEVCEITIQDVEIMYAGQAGCCAVTGIPFRLEHYEECRRNPYGISIDRKDNSMGYTPSNCRLVLVFVNTALSDYGESVFWDVLRKTFAADRFSDELMRSALKRSGK